MLIKVVQPLRYFIKGPTTKEMANRFICYMAYHMNDKLLQKGKNCGWPPNDSNRPGRFFHNCEFRVTPNASCILFSFTTQRRGIRTNCGVRFDQYLAIAVRLRLRVSACVFLAPQLKRLTAFSLHSTFLIDLLTNKTPNNVKKIVLYDLPW